MAKICAAAEAAEDHQLDADFTGQTFRRIDQSIAMGALFTAHHLGAKAIVAMTDSGATAHVDEPPPHPHPHLRPHPQGWRRSARWRCTATCARCSWTPARTVTRRWSRPKAI